jgi:hypothetical protein
MAVQPARIARADLRHINATPRLRVPRTARISASAQVAARPIRVPARVAARAGTHAVRAVATTPWAGVDIHLRSRLRPSAAILAAVIVATMLGLVYVTQVLAAQNARYSVDRLLDERHALMRTLGSQEAKIVNLGSEGEVVAWALDQGLDRLSGTLRVKAR